MKAVGSQRLESTQVVVNSDWMCVRHDIVRDSTGQRQDYWVLSRPSFVVIVPKIPDGRVVLARKHRYPLDRWFWELPQRRLGDETPAAVYRLITHTLADTSLRLGDPSPPVHIGAFYEAYGYSDHRGYVVTVAVEMPDCGPHGNGIRLVSSENLLVAMAEAGVEDAASLAAAALYVTRDK